MQKIKIIGALIFLLSLTLAFLFTHTSQENSLHDDSIAMFNKQKDFTQEISKNIFYIYKNPNSSTEALENSIKLFLNSIKEKNSHEETNQKITKLWNNFYLLVQHFRDNIKNKSPYSNIIIERVVKDIYNTNLELIMEFNNIIIKKEKDFKERKNRYKFAQYSLFALLVLLLLYIFTQLKIVMLFLQKFLSTSKKIISNASIKELEPLRIDSNIGDLSEAKENFNTLVEKINSSIIHSSSSIEHSCRSIESLEQNIEDLIDLIYEMNNNRDKELRKKEDTVIQSLEELSSTLIRLKNLKENLDELISYSNLPDTKKESSSSI